MDIHDLHPWPQDYRAARELQLSLASRVDLQPPRKHTWRWVAGADVSSTRFSSEVWAAVVLIAWPGGRVVEQTFARQATSFPYVPGLLSFREIPVILEAMRSLQTVPELVFCDGQGLAHPRFFGLACHLGLWLNLPTIGCAKTRLVGEGREPGQRPGDRESLNYQDHLVGMTLRTRRCTKPIYVSPGHLMDVETAMELTLSFCLHSRQPEPLRLAHLAVNGYRLGQNTNVT